MFDPAIQSVLSAQQAAIQIQIQYALAAKQQSAVKQQGAAVVELLLQAANIAKSAGQGVNFDRRA